MASSLVYGFTGPTNFPTSPPPSRQPASSLGLIFGIVFIIAGLAFKVSAVPFHMWTPDVYEGAPTPVTAFFASAPKFAAMALFIRVMMTPFTGATHDWQQILVFVSIASMALGAFAAIGQSNIKRLLAYSSIGHMGFALVGLAAGTQQGVSGTVIYMMIYMIMTLGSFACVIAMRRNGQSGRGDRRSRGPRPHRQGPRLCPRHADVLARRHPAARRLLRQIFRVPRRHPVGPLCACHSSASSPAWSAPTIICGSSRSCISTSRRAAFDAMDGEVKTVAYAAGIFVLFFVVFANPLLNMAEAAAKSFPLH